MAFKNCELNDNELRKYDPGYPWQEWLHGEFMPRAGTIDRENDIRLFKYGNGPVDEPSDLYQFIFDYKGIPFQVQLGRVLEDWDVHWRGCCFLNEIDGLEYDHDAVMQALRDAMTVYAYGGYGSVKTNEKVTVHIEF